MARANTVHRIILERKRGVIYDGTGGPVANSPVWNLEVNSRRIAHRSRTRAAELSELARNHRQAGSGDGGGAPRADPYGSAARRARNLTQAQSSPSTERLPDLPGASIVQRAIGPTSTR